MGQHPIINSIRGIIPPMVTPLTTNNQLDLEGAEKLVEHILQGRVHGLFILGTTGEAVSLTIQARIEFTARVCHLVRKRVPVLVGITDNSFADAVYFAGKVHEVGADAVVVAPPFYYLLQQQELYQYIENLTKEISLPLFLYNIPIFTKNYFNEDTIYKASKLPGVIGYKDSTGNMTHFHKMISMVDPEFVVLVGPEILLAESVLFGGYGGVNGGANMFPDLYTKLYDLAKNKHINEIMELQHQVIQIYRNIYSFGGTEKSVISGIKATLSVLGICSPTMAAPLQALSLSEIKQIEAFLKTWEL